MERVADVNWPSGANAIFSARMGKVRIFTDAPREKFTGIVDDFGDKVTFEGHALKRLSRVWDVEPHWGGAQMVEAGSMNDYDCTSGFSVRTGGGNPQPRMVTAAHCFPLNATVNSPHPNGDSFGTVKTRTNFPTNDFELVGGTGIGQGPAIYVGGSTGTKADVANWASAQFDQFYCFSGATSTEECGLFMTDNSYSYCDEAGCTTQTQVFDGFQGEGACHGDSGSPFFKYNASDDVVILGIVIVGEEFPNDPFLTICKANSDVVIIEKYSKISSTYNVELKTI